MTTKSRRAYIKLNLAGDVDQFKVGDIVTTWLVEPSSNFLGTVTEVSTVANKVWVAWPGGNIKQHDPDELVLSIVNGASVLKRRMASGRMDLAEYDSKDAKNDPTFVGIPKQHGLDEPISGGTNVMQQLVEKQLKEQKKNVGELFTASGLRSRRGMYHIAPGRMYRLTRQERDSGAYICPKCREEGMEQQPFTKSDKLVVCPACGWKVQTSCLVAE